MFRPLSPSSRSPGDAGIGEALAARGQYQAALQHYLGMLRQHPEAAESHFNVGSMLLQLQQPESATQHFQEAIRLKPDYAIAHDALAQVLLVQGHIWQSVSSARKAAELAPHDVDLAVGLANVLVSAGQSAEAREIVGRLRGIGDESTRFALIRARLASTADEAEATLALSSRLLKSSPPKPVQEQSSLHFAIANLLDWLGRYDQAFEHASRANELRGLTYNPRLIEGLVGQFMAYFTSAKMRRLVRATHGSEAPVFIVGMARSGSSLVEQILTSHAAVHGAGELGWIFRLWQSAARRPFAAGVDSPYFLDRLSVQQADELAAEYLTPLRALAPHAQRITDKMLANFMNLGLIATLFPQARVIHCRRDPLDTCLSCHLTEFAAPQNFSVDLSSAGHLYRQTEALMAHWKGVLDLPILEMDYEQVVGDLEGQARRLVEFLGLPWDERCLRFHENRRFVATASEQQVRKPVYRSSVGRWKNYEKHLGPLRAVLR